MPTDVQKSFWLLLVKSPAALFVVGCSWICGYGISFMLFDYRKTDVKKSHGYLHVSVGTGYSAFVFLLVNFDLLSRAITVDQLVSRLPFTFLISFSLLFLVIVGVGVMRELRSPYASRGRR